MTDERYWTPLARPERRFFRSDWCPYLSRPPNNRPRRRVPRGRVKRVARHLFHPRFSL